MIKRLELTDPNSCMSRAREDEPTFVILGRDVAAPMVIIEWIKLRIAIGKNKMDDPQIVEACQCVCNMIRYREALADGLIPPDSGASQ